MSQLVEVKGLNELLASMRAYPRELVQTAAVAVNASLMVFWENVPPYPSKPIESTYDRTGLLGKSLGSDEGGGASGNPSIYKITQLGQGNFQGTFGTSLDYAPHVIGDMTQAPQNLHWWQMVDITIKAQFKVAKIWQDVGSKLAAFLERKA